MPPWTGYVPPTEAVKPEPPPEAMKPFAEEDRIITAEEIVPILERGALKRRHMTAQQMVDAYKAGKLDEPHEVMDLLGLAFLLPEYHPLYAPLG